MEGPPLPTLELMEGRRPVDDEEVMPEVPRLAVVVDAMREPEQFQQR